MRNKLLAILLCAAALPAAALTTDRDQPIEVNADRFNGDEVKQTAVYSGNVIVTQGSMRITGERLELRLTPKGYRQAEVTGKAHFRQQRDPKGAVGPDEWVHAEASNILYDEEEDKITLTGAAKLSRVVSGVEKDITRGEKIVYDMRNARSIVDGGVVDGQRRRVTTIIAPRTQQKADDAPRRGAELSTSTSLSTDKK